MIKELNFVRNSKTGLYEAEVVATSNFKLQIEKGDAKPIYFAHKCISDGEYTAPLILSQTEITAVSLVNGVTGESTPEYIKLTTETLPTKAYIIGESIA